MNHYRLVGLLLHVSCFYTCTCLGPFGMMYPKDSESRTVKLLDGMWNFRVDDSSNRNRGFEEKWYSVPLRQTGEVIPMPVPSSYNDITQEKRIRDFVGWAWYDREFFLPQDWTSKRVVLRVDSAHYNAIVWVNSVELVRHEGGHLPFEGEITRWDIPIVLGGNNRLTIAINNTLSPTTLPPGTIQYQHDINRYPEGYFVQNLQMDFFNYAGLHRHIQLYTTPKTYVQDVIIATTLQGLNGLVKYTVSTSGQPGNVQLAVEIIDRDGRVVGHSNQFQDTITVGDGHFWWPYTMNSSSPGYLYTFEMNLTLLSSGVSDVYRQQFGIREVKVTDKQLLINDRPFYCHGVAKHEDSDIRGKGLDFALIAKDFNLLKWLGANCFRTSHYPYAEEIMDMADQQGIVVINESPGVGIRKANNFGNLSLAHHLKVMDEMYRRDKNRPAVILWSVANEPDTTHDNSIYYFKTLLSHVRFIDSTRPVTFVANSDFSSEKVAQYTDIICLNHYNAWYQDCSHTELIQRQLTYDLRQWYAKFRKPIMITEYGADTIEGFHQDPSIVFTEEFQVEFMTEYHKTFDNLRHEFLVGEMVWNFADFMTAQGITRAFGNRKGIFTRQRRPKTSAHLLRSRYQAMINNTSTVRNRHTGR
ncbi:beta-glucuronidase-like [Mizuhopecten yessoensis]|uniref:Beta-glucuronidase n=1 Tax=Mizuhopecten yessoensis TaxID=6573 RepID=A0A210PUW7_MIZYE|nr:beta-glucuronidase-like [Mizuhopecten yessoensis]OWF40254.1 Beta-glucuronidase [Mizuhopecten yessoensis]